MKRFAAMAIVPLFAGYLCAQSSQTTTTTTTTWNGTLVDAGCRTTHTEHKETSTDENATTTKTETSRSVTDCPVTTTTTTFGLVTPTHEYIRFDEPSNTRIVETIKKNKRWTTEITERKPVSVRVVGTPSGEVVVMRSIR